MLAEEIFDLGRQIIDIGLTFYDWKLPCITAGNKEVALRIGYELAGRMQDLRNFIRAETDDAAWPVHRYGKRKVWPEEYGNVQRQPLLPSMEEASGFEPFQSPSMACQFGD